MRNEGDSMPEIRYRWIPVEIDSGIPFEFSDNAIRSVPRILAKPAVYRWAVFEKQILRKVCIGETEDLRRRVREYLKPDPLQETNKRLNAKFKMYIQDGLTVRLESLEIAPVHLNRVLICNQTLSDPFVRGLMENFTLADVDVTQCEILNLTQHRLDRRKRKASKNNPFEATLRESGMNYGLKFGATLEVAQR